MGDDLEVVDDMSEWAQTAAKRAQELGLQFSSHFQDSVCISLNAVWHASDSPAGQQALQTLSDI